MPQRTTCLVLLAFVLLDTGYSFVQHLHVALDGDMAPIVLPAQPYQQMMGDPFGLGVLSNEKYGAPNRFFAHWPMSAYFKHIPKLLQIFVRPVDSIYLACALAKTAIQLMLVAILAIYISDKAAWRGRLLAAAIVVPFFQAFGYNLQMGFIEKSITYTFFYPLPLALLLLFFLPFYRTASLGFKPKFSMAQHGASFGLALMLPFSGPLIPAVALLVCPLMVLQKWLKAFTLLPQLPIAQRALAALKRIPKPMLYYFLLIGLLSLWSLYVGSFNIENTGGNAPPSLLARYPALLKGLGSIFTLKLGMPLLALGIAANMFIISRSAPGEGRKRITEIGTWLALFVVVYLLLLPLGGYRSYRNLIVRHDTIMPVTLCLVFYYGLTTFYLLRNLAGKYRQKYAWCVAALSLVVTSADLPNFRHNACEKAALEAIQASKEPIVKLDSDCPVMGWNKKTTAPDESKSNAELLKIWGVTAEVRLYYSE